MYGDPGYEGPEVGVTPYGFAQNFTPELLRRLHAAYAGEVRERAFPTADQTYRPKA